MKCNARAPLADRARVATKENLSEFDRSTMNLPSPRRPVQTKDDRAAERGRWKEGREGSPVQCTFLCVFGPPSTLVPLLHTRRNDRRRRRDALVTPRSAIGATPSLSRLRTPSSEATSECAPKRPIYFVTLCAMDSRGPSARPRPSCRKLGLVFSMKINQVLAICYLFHQSVREDDASYLGIGTFLCPLPVEGWQGNSRFSNLE